MLAVKYDYIFLVYMVDGIVMITFIPKQVNHFVLLELNCKKIAKGLLKSLNLYINVVMKRTIFRKYIKLFLCLSTGVGITAIRKLCRSDCSCFFYLGLIYPTHFL